MATFLVECYWVGVVEADARRALERLGRSGGPRRPGAVTPLVSFLLPSEEVLFVLVEAASPSSVLRASLEAGIPADRVSRAVELERDSFPPS